MKKLLICAVLLFAALSASPLPPSAVENMYQNCKEYMDRGVCRVQLDKKDYPNETIMTTCCGRIKTSSYLKIRNAGVTMCDLIKQVCTEDPNGDDCKAARSGWKQTR